MQNAVTSAVKPPTSGNMTRKSSPIGKQNITPGFQDYNPQDDGDTYDDCGVMDDGKLSYSEVAKSRYARGYLNPCERSGVMC